MNLHEDTVTSLNRGSVKLPEDISEREFYSYILTLPDFTTKLILWIGLIGTTPSYLAPRHLYVFKTIEVLEKLENYCDEIRRIRNGI
jgi:hypothetical protein